MKNKTKKEKNEYSALKNKLYRRALVMLLVAAVAVFCAYFLFLKGHFAIFLVNFMQSFWGYEIAYDIYKRIFRNNFEFFFLIAILAVFYVFLYLYIRGFIRYFRQINEAIDTLLDREAGNALLPPELAPVERKIHSVRETLALQRDEIQNAEKRKRELIMYLAHDLKTPLASVIGYLTLLRDEEKISDELRARYLSISLDKAERLEDLINEFFEITRFDLSGVDLQVSRVNLTRLLEQLVYEFTPMLKEKELSCELHAGEDWMVRIDAEKMQRVFDNLLRNAVLYSFPGTKIEISAACREDGWSVTFTNCGNTIPQEKLERIFEQFYRLDSARSTRSGGAGLGLAIAKQIVELHGGTITAQSHQEQTQFTVTVPGPVEKS